MSAFNTIGDLALGLYESGRYDSVCDALDMVVRCGGNLHLRDLLVFGLSAHHLGRRELAEWCQRQARELASRDDGPPVETRGLVLAVERLLAEPVSTTSTTSLLDIRIQRGREP